ncbi:MULTISPECIES: 3D domain-containing protein [Pelosinus]|uniref:3D domain-containing protein n=1 Tax=Pelosinus fermentans B4 TaxID=1149862 RepID=I8RMB3_9FIRM|nr:MULTISPECIES: 3D domain-containing protein [Pelosinus]EIW19940.1 3D domain-containing protein [Pelosinus fermentans B4]EIW21203.1 3D domain-containing protein [Pelosinus fermentans A11]
MYIGKATNWQEVCPAPGRQEAGQVQERGSEEESKGGAAIEKESSSQRTELPAGRVDSTDDPTNEARNRGIHEGMESAQPQDLPKGLDDRAIDRGSTSPSRGVRAGVFKVTAYANGIEDTGKQPGDPGYGITASGRPTVEGRTIAADWDVLPPGTRVYIEGVGYRIVDDRGGAIVGQKIDLYIDADKATLDAWGVQYLEVYVIGKEG